MKRQKKNGYDSHASFHVAVDCIIFGYDGIHLKILLVKRSFEPEKGKWTLVGGFLKDEESLDDAAVRVLFELTGLSDLYLEQLYAYGDVQRDSAGRVISVAYYTLINTEVFNGLSSKKYDGKWHGIHDVPDLIFDHSIMVTKALRRLRRRAKTQPIGFELLPEKFTIPQLLNLYEAIYDREFDKRNFRKKILTLNVLEKLTEKDMKSSRKGAFYYKFNVDKYNQLIINGFVFDILSN
jgi:8-oxo-dGTP diphosphatase